MMRRDALRREFFIRSSYYTGYQKRGWEVNLIREVRLRKRVNLRLGGKGRQKESLFLTVERNRDSNA
jgi:hypothetical protein